MNRHVNAIAGRLSLRPPQRRSLEILDRITEIVPPRRGADVQAALDAVRSKFPTVTDFEREFPSLCFALATGVGKTRLMGAFISYLHLAHGITNFFMMAPNLTIYNKLIADLRGETWRSTEKGTKQLTATGLVAVFTALSALIVGALNTSRGNDEKEQMQRRLTAIQSASEKSLRVVYKAFVDIFPGRLWEAPNRIPAGSIVEFHNFDSELELWRGTDHAVRVAKSNQAPVRVPVVGFAGEMGGKSYGWSLRSLGPGRSSGFVYVYSLEEMEGK